MNTEFTKLISLDKSTLLSRPLKNASVVAPDPEKIIPDPGSSGSEMNLK
jgi:hypothetical protein